MHAVKWFELSDGGLGLNSILWRPYVVLGGSWRVYSIFWRQCCCLFVVVGVLLSILEIICCLMELGGYSIFWRQYGVLWGLGRFTQYSGDNILFYGGTGEFLLYSGEYSGDNMFFVWGGGKGYSIFWRQYGVLWGLGRFTILCLEGRLLNILETICSLFGGGKVKVTRYSGGNMVFCGVWGGLLNILETICSLFGWGEGYSIFWRQYGVLWGLGRFTQCSGDNILFYGGLESFLYIL